MMDPPLELVVAVIAISAHDNHWVAHGAMPLHSKRFWAS